ncbi:MAG: PQQ-binding-like beta-propeller repeat protein [Bacteroidota bacterium]
MNRQFVILAVLAFILANIQSNAQSPSQEMPPLSDSSDILQEVLQAQLQQPTLPSEFEPGAVTPRLIKDFMELNLNGFEIQLPSRGMAPSPTIYEGTAYVSGGFGSRQFYAFNAQSGKTKWAIDLSDDGPSAGVVEDGVLVFNTESCTIFALNAESGEMKWSYYLGDPLMSTPTIANGMVFTAYPAKKSHHFSVPSTPNQSPIIQDMNVPGAALPKMDRPLKRDYTHALIAFDLHTGTILWQKWIDGDVMSAPVAEDKDLYVTTFPGTVFRIEQETGKIMSAKIRQATSAPVISGDYLLLSQRADNNHGVQEQLNVLDRTTNQSRGMTYTRSAPYLDVAIQSRSSYSEQAKSYDAGNGFGMGAPAASGWQAAAANVGQVSVSSLQAYQGSRMLAYQKWHYSTMGNELVCTEAKNGKVAWTYSLPGSMEEAGGHLATPPLEVGGNILICTLGGELLLFKAQSGKLLYQKKMKEQVRAQPVVDLGKIYLTTMSGKFICLDTGQKKLTGWPTWGGNAAHTNRAE